MSSGLRINTAADDPSGLAVAEKLQAQVDGFDQAARNVQDANNAATVAEGALQTTTDILQRIRTLAVEAASDVTSSTDKQNLQSEVSQLLLEINRIAEDTQFNGIALLDGSHAGFQPEQPATVQIATNAALASAGSGTIALTGAAVNVPDGDFNSYAPANNANSGYYGPATLGNWQITTGGSTGLFYYRGNGGVGAQPPGGGQAQGAFLYTSSGTVAIQQTIGGLTAGETYALSFYAADDSTAPALGVQVNGTTVQTVSLGATYQQYTVQFVASGSSATIGFSLPNGSGYTVADLSAVTVNQVVPTQVVDSGLLIASALGIGTSFQTAYGGVAGIGSGTGTVDGTIEVQVINTGTSIAAQETFIDSATGDVTVSPTLLAPDMVSALFDNVQVITGNFTTADVGAASYVKVSQNVPAASNPNAPALTIQSGAAEGATIQIGIPATNTAALRVSNINVISSATANPSLAAEDAIGQVDLALQMVLTQRAELGAITVRLNEDQDNDNIASVNLQASESAIRDLDVAEETTTFNRLQILVQVGTSVLAQSNTNAQSILRLFP